MDWFYNAFDAAQQWLFVQVIQPLAFWAGAGNLLEQGYGATEWLLVGVLQITVLVLVLGPAQRLWPVERMHGISAGPCPSPTAAPCAWTCSTPCCTGWGCSSC